MHNNIFITNLNDDVIVNQIFNVHIKNMVAGSYILLNCKAVKGCFVIRNVHIYIYIYIKTYTYYELRRLAYFILLKFSNISRLEVINY